MIRYSLWRTQDKETCRTKKIVKKKKKNISQSFFLKNKWNHAEPTPNANLHSSHPRLHHNVLHGPPNARGTTPTYAIVLSLTSFLHSVTYEVGIMPSMPSRFLALTQLTSLVARTMVRRSSLEKGRSSGEVPENA